MGPSPLAIPRPCGPRTSLPPARPPTEASELSTGAIPPVVLEKVTKVFGRFAALREVSASFDAGRLYAIFGDNGAGKSTLLRVISGLARTTSGSVTLLGSADLRSVLSQIGYMAHAPLLYDEMTGLENLRYFAGLYGRVEYDKLREAIRGVGLDPELERYVGQYSQGMRQRLSLARATLHDPKLLLLDEPFSNLDPQSSQAMSRLLGGMRDGGRTILVVTHQAAHVADIADESVWMSAGKIVDRRAGIAAADHSGRDARQGVSAEARS